MRCAGVIGSGRRLRELELDGSLQRQIRKFVLRWSSATPALLAANTNLEIPGHRSTRRPATPKEIAIVRQLAKQWLAEYGLDQGLLKQGIMGTVTSTELRKGGGRAIIGRFDVRSKSLLSGVQDAG